MMKTIATAIVLSGLALSAAPSFAAGMATPAVLADSSMGKIWVNNLGLTLYTFEKDTATKSNCNGDCAVEWPPLAVAADATASGDWTIVTRDDGTKMWAYEGHPLYSFLDDKKAGDITGDNKDGFHVAK